MTNRQQAALKTREKLVEAAGAIISERGLDGTSVEEITLRAGVANGTFYTYFKRKEDIVFELSRGMFAEILENAKRAEGGILKKLEVYMTSFSTYIETSSLKLCQEWTRSVVMPECLEDEEQRGKLARDIADIKELLSFGREQGMLRAEAPIELIARTLVDLLYGEMLCWCMSGGAYSYGERTALFCRTFLPQIMKNYLQGGNI